MTPPEPKGSITAKPEHANTEKPEENDLKNNLNRMFEILKEKFP